MRDLWVSVDSEDSLPSIWKLLADVALENIESAGEIDEMVLYGDGGLSTYGLYVGNGGGNATGANGMEDMGTGELDWLTLGMKPGEVGS